MKKPTLAVITGLTASGKSALAYDLWESYRAKNITCEIVCCDSMLIYKELDIGTDKPSAEILQRIPHHLVNMISPDEPFSVGDYVREAKKTIAAIHNKNALPILVGGTGLYLRALTHGLLQLPEMDEQAVEQFRKRLAQQVQEEGSCKNLYAKLEQHDLISAKRIHPNDLYRIIRALEVLEFTGKPLSDFQSAHAFQESPYETVTVAIEWPREEIYRRIEARLDHMLERGLEEEIKRLLDKGYSPLLRPLQGLAYRHFIEALAGRMSREQALALTKRESRHFAKRQATWFRPLADLHWLAPSEDLLERAAGLFSALL